MHTNLQELYATAIRPLSDPEKLRIATLILEDVTNHPLTNGRVTATSAKRGGKLSDLFGSVSSGYTTGADNEQIDADLAREYGRGLDGDD